MTAIGRTGQPVAPFNFIGSIIRQNSETPFWINSDKFKFVQKVDNNNISNDPNEFNALSDQIVI